MNVSEAEKHIRLELIGLYDENESRNIAELIFEDAGISRNMILLQKELKLSHEQISKLAGHLARLKEHEPVQYILNKSHFYGMELYVDKNVLIPRPETEELVEWIIKDVRTSGKDVFIRKPNESDETTKLKILDIGTGSGCVALALKKNMPKAEVWGCDNSDDALSIARRNGSLLDIRVDFQGLDFLNEDEQKQLPTVDIIVSNPPYIPLSNKELMQANVVNFEPHNALFVPNEDPLVFYKAIALFGKRRLYPNGKIYLEIHEDLGKDVLSVFEKQDYEVELKKDMQGKERMVRASTK